MKVYETRCEIIRLIREFFWAEGFVETDTPLAVRFPGQEPYLNPIPLTIHDTRLRPGFDGQARGLEHRMYLHTSPEFSMKKLLAAGFEKIFQITKTFRDYESFGGNHNPEFTMIEWYRAPGTYQDFMDDTERLFKFVGARLKIKELRLKDYKIAVDQTWERASMRELWQKYVGVELNEFLELDKLVELVKLRGYQVNDGDTYDDLFFKIFLNEMEPKLGIEKPIFIYDYPAQMASLSRLCEHDPRYAERVECYIGGLELSNGFGELTDAEEQQKRLENDRALRQKLGKETWPVDPDFIAALRSGVPANEISSDGPSSASWRIGAAASAAGVAMGVDRMVVLFTGAKDINEVIFDSVADQLI